MLGPPACGYVPTLHYSKPQLWENSKREPSSYGQIVKSREQVMDDSVGRWRIILSYGYTSLMLGR